MTGGQKDWYTAIIVWSKAILAVGAVVLLSTLFLFANRVDVTDAILYADIDVDRLIAEQRMSAPVFTTYTQDETAIVVEGGYSKPFASDPSVLEVSNISATVSPKTAPQITFGAGSAYIDQARGMATLANNVEMAQTAGFVIKAPIVQIDIEAETFEASQNIEAKAPFGTLTAEKLMVQRISDNLIYDFQGGVHLIYVPKD
ncbi:MAG: hypothetical protein ACWA40_07110 [Planktomarina sp.]